MVTKRYYNTEPVLWDALAAGLFILYNSAQSDM